MLQNLYHFSETLDPILIIDFFLRNKQIKLFNPNPSPNSSPKISTTAPEAECVEGSVFKFEL